MTNHLKIDEAVPCPFLHGWKRRLTLLGGAILAAEWSAAYRVDVIIVDDAAITELNTKYLRHPWATDVIAFPLGDEKDNILEGEIYISRDTAVRQAGIYGVQPAEEVARLLTHGLLHLCGYTDDTPMRKRAIRRRENRYLGLHDIAIGEPDAYSGR